MKATENIKTINKLLESYKHNMTKAEKGLTEIEKSCYEIDKLIGSVKVQR